MSAPRAWLRCAIRQPGGGRSGFSRPELHAREAGVGVAWRQRFCWAPLASPLMERKSHTQHSPGSWSQLLSGWCCAVEVRPDAACSPEGETYGEVSDPLQVFVMRLIAGRSLSLCHCLCAGTTVKTMRASDDLGGRTRGSLGA